MPILSNPRRELFAQNLVKGMTQADAYEAAGYRWNDSSASRMAKLVAARVAELQGRTAERSVITAVKLIELAEEARLLAMENKHSSAAVSAIREMGVLAGVRVEKRATAPRTPNEMSDDELAKIARSGGAGPREA